MSHRLDPLLRPVSLAIVGASPRPGSYGRGLVEAIIGCGYDGALYLVNPNHERIDDRPSYPSMKDLPEPVEHAVFGVSNEHLEGALADAIDAGIKAATIFASGYMAGDGQPPLLDRLKSTAHRAGIEICGGNCGGFYNRQHKVRCQLAADATEEEPGRVALICQSGSAYAALVINDGRLRWNLTVSSGQEIATDAAAYLDFALELETTRAVGLFIETVRQPAAFVAALEKAAEKDVPVVVLKVARTAASKAFAFTHSGALAGDDAAYDAIFRRYGALRVGDLDEMMAALQIMSAGRRAGPGGLVAITDSGGERELLADVASDEGVPFADIAEDTRARLEARLEYGLVAENPLDAWGTIHDFDTVFPACMDALLRDGDAGLGLWLADIRDASPYHQRYLDSVERIPAGQDKPLAFATCFSKGVNPQSAERLRRLGIPLLEGIRPALVAARCAFAYRDFKTGADHRFPASPEPTMVDRWRRRLGADRPLDQAEGLAMLAEFGIPAVEMQAAASVDEAVAAADAVGYPVALKTAEADIPHKTEAGGVRLGLTDSDAVAVAYQNMARRLGPRASVSPMAASGPELAFGFVRDDQFGPLAMVGAGGVLVEVLADTCFVVPPASLDVARDAIDRLALRPLLDGVRGRPPVDFRASAEAFSAFTVMIDRLGDALAELDVNPLIVAPDGVFAVDALILSRATSPQPDYKEHP